MGCGGLAGADGVGQSHRIFTAESKGLRSHDLVPRSRVTYPTGTFTTLVIATAMLIILVPCLKIPLKKTNLVSSLLSMKALC